MNVPAYLAVARVARRQALRAPWRSLLIVAMVALPIAALTTTAIAIRTSVPTDAERITEQFGTADLEVYPNHRTTTSDVAAALPTGSRIASVGFLSITRPLVEHASIVYFSVFEYGVPVDRPPVRGMYRILEGAAPTGPGEAAVGPAIMQVLGLHIGDTFSPRRGVDLRITGTVVSAGHLNDPVVVLGPGTLASLVRDRIDEWLVQLPPEVSPTTAAERLSAVHLAAGDTVSALQDHQNDEQKGTAGAFAAAAVMLLATGLIAGAAFAVGARRQLRTLGLLGASGAERRHVRATVVLTGTTLGAVGSAVGLGLGIAAAFPIHPYLDRLAGRYVGPIDVPWVPLLGAFALGTVAATVAAYLPARTASKISVLQALAERAPPPRRPGRIAAVGVGAVVAGAAIAAWATGPTVSAKHAWILTGGIVVMIVGILVGIPMLVSWTGRLAGVLPTLARIAARDIARNGRRTGAALAAGAIALGLPVAIATESLADQARYEPTPYLAVDQFHLWGFGSGEAVAREVAAAMDDLRAAFPGSIAARLVPAVTTISRHGRLHESSAYRIRWMSDGYSSQPLYIADAEVLRALHAEGGIGALERGEVVAVGQEPGGGGRLDVGLSIRARPRPRILARGVPVSSAGGFQDAGGYFVSAARAADLGLRPSSEPIVNAVFRAAAPLSSSDIARAKDIVSRQPDVAATSEADLSGGADTLRLVTTIAGMVIALMIVGVIVALLSAESRRDRAILVAVGAGPRSRRGVAGATAALIAALSAAFAVIVGLVPTSVLLQVENQDQPFIVPWAVIAIVVFATPVFAGVLAGLVSREPKAAQLLRPIA